jgi:hypothetical protein
MTLDKRGKGCLVAGSQKPLDEVAIRPTRITLRHYLAEFTQDHAGSGSSHESRRP